MVRVLVRPGDPTSHSQQVPAELSIRILTHNIRYATSSLLENERPWKDRFPLLMSQFSYHTRFLNELNQKANTLKASTCDGSRAAFICMQEVLHNQLYDIMGQLNHIKRDQTQRHEDLPRGPTWASIGVGREDGRTKGEYNPILYPAQIFDLIHFENTWLSPTPDKPSRGWDAACVRILTAGVFEHKITKKRLAVFNTHLDHVGSEARKKSIRIITDVIERVCTKWQRDVDSAVSEGLEYFLAGDFNSFPTQGAYKAVIASNTMVDVHDAVVASERYGSEVTFTGFRPDTDRDRNEIGRIDFIWLGPKANVHGVWEENSEERSRGWKVQGYSVLPNVFDDGVFCSDHRCVVADANLCFE